ncbi:hypothetical protein LNTAR_07529 [Lentisphaera araneosa HTCC2155]|uniref:Glycoside hydrolase family 5 domain-containing protein n=1 Tax=Lentisphaera araneosa HTCC2155 TaxID=313628 RepID=A6DN41_9BACT|nr:hypothetical protein [Lentisphaera araneosa]EDM27077.1 hypothetical protein LNTAR_07529 [Lentisphaera araneosa HTCC2155]
MHALGKIPELLLIVFMLLSSICSGTEKGKAVPKIVIRNGKFITKANGKIFVPFGVNYCVFGKFENGKPGYASFSPTYYDSSFVEKMMAYCKKNGFNTIRVFHAYVSCEDGILESRSAREFSPEYMTNVIHLLEQARIYNIYLIWTFDIWTPPSKWLSEQKTVADGKYAFQKAGGVDYNRNAFYMDLRHARNRANNIVEMIRAIRKHDPELLTTVFSWQLENELYSVENFAPYKLKQFTYNGKNYDLANGKGKQKLMDDVVSNWCNYLTTAIKHEDIEALVSVGVFPFKDVGMDGPGDWSKPGRRDKRVPARPLVLLKTEIDFLDIHFYVWREGNKDELYVLDQKWKSVEKDKLLPLAKKLEKPIMVGETGLFNNYTDGMGLSIPQRVTLASKYLKNHIEALRKDYGVAGVLFWTFGTPSKPNKKLYYDLYYQHEVKEAFIQAWEEGEK